MQKSKFDILFESIITEMNADGFYPAKYTDGTQAIGIDAAGREQIWMIGPIKDKHNIDYFTKEELPQYTTCLWLPNKFGFKKGIVISIDSYEANKDNPKLKELGLIKDIDFENA